MYNKKYIILDFDGTIFRLFTNYNLNRKIPEIIEMFNKYGINANGISDVFDGFKILAMLNDAKLKESLCKELNDKVIQYELEALKSGILIDGFLNFLSYCQENNFKIAIVTNNSNECIEAFFMLYKINYDIPVVGRIYNKPEYMKPDTHLLSIMCDKLNVKANDIVYIGDNYRDYTCAINYNCDFLAMTPTISKKQKLIEKALNLTYFNNYNELILFLKNN